MLLVCRDCSCFGFVPTLLVCREYSDFGGCSCVTGLQRLFLFRVCSYVTGLQRVFWFRWLFLCYWSAESVLVSVVLLTLLVYRDCSGFSGCPCAGGLS